MAANTRTKFQRERDLERISAMYCMGKYQHEIAAIIGVDRSQISLDLKKIQKRWRESSIIDMNEAKQRELTRIDNLERVAWESFNKSAEQFVKLTNETESRGVKDKDGKPVASKGKVTKVTEDRCGDPRFLMVIKDCIDKRCKILGLDEAQKIGFDDSVGEVKVTIVKRELKQGEKIDVEK